MPFGTTRNFISCGLLFFSIVDQPINLDKSHVLLMDVRSCKLSPLAESNVRGRMYVSIKLCLECPGHNCILHFDANSVMLCIIL